jgi:hypothetical protein
MTKFGKNAKTKIFINNLLFHKNTLFDGEDQKTDSLPEDQRQMRRSKDG